MIRYFLLIYYPFENNHAHFMMSTAKTCGKTYRTPNTPMRAPKGACASLFTVFWVFPSANVERLRLRSYLFEASSVYPHTSARRGILIVYPSHVVVHAGGDTCASDDHKHHRVHERVGPWRSCNCSECADALRQCVSTFHMS